MAATAGGLASADGLCRACVDLLGVNGAAVSVIRDGASVGTFGSSGELSRRLDEFQFTFGEGPCLDAVRDGWPVLATDLTLPAEVRWPAFAGAVLAAGVRAVFALPVVYGGTPIGALDLFRNDPGALRHDDLVGGLFAAKLAVLPLIDLMNADVDWEAASEGGRGVPELASLERVEVYQATGMIMAQCDIGPDEALIRLRAYAFTCDRTASEVAWEVIRGEVTFDGQTRWPQSDGGEGTTS